MSESKHNLRSRKHLDYASINAGKSVQFPAYGFSPDPRPLQAPVGENTPRVHQTHDFTKTKRLLEEEKERNTVLEETSQLEEMRKELGALRTRNAALEKRASCSGSSKGNHAKRSAYKPSCDFQSGTVSIILCWDIRGVTSCFLTFVCLWVSGPLLWLVSESRTCDFQSGTVFFPVVFRSIRR